jgi:hypothetical protein
VDTAFKDSEIRKIIKTDINIQTRRRRFIDLSADQLRGGAEVHNRLKDLISGCR